MVDSTRHSQCWPSGFPTDLLIEADDVPLDGISEALAGLAEGRFAGKVMVVPSRATRQGPADAHTFYPSGTPRLNHVALSLPPTISTRPTGTTSAGSGARCSASTSSRS